MRQIFVLASAACCLGLAADAQQTRFEDLKAARPVFWGALYPNGFEELYCGAVVADRGDHNIEHVFPAAWLVDAFGCGSRAQCRRSSPGFRRAEADLHNLYPTRVKVNEVRSSHPFGEIAGEDHDFARCDFEEEDGLVEPRESVRGEIARAVLYMARAYDAQAGMPRGQIALMLAWDEADPPDRRERARNERIAELQGAGNPFVAGN